MSKNVEEIVSCWLKDNGYDGLYNPLPCGCELSDYVPCEIINGECVAAYKFNCGLCEKTEMCGNRPFDVEPDGWFMSPNKDYCTPQYRKENKQCRTSRLT